MSHPFKHPNTISSILGPSISKEDALKRLKADPEAYNNYLRLPITMKEQLLLFLQGSKGLRISYDPMFRKILNPTDHPERLANFISAILGQHVKIDHVMQREGVQLSEYSSLVIMDIICKLESGAIVNVEMQKIGYLFPGERTDCYFSDMVMRQYNVLKGEKKQYFSFKDMKPIYIIIIMENSSKEFKAVAPEYLHRKECVYSSGVEVASLENVTYISLDTFRKHMHNIDNKLNAWLTFFSSDEPADIIRLINAYPEFKEFYSDMAEFRVDVRRLTDMFSDTLKLMDQNTMTYMVEEQQKALEEKDKVIETKEKVIEEKDKVIETKEKVIEEKDNALENANQLIEKLQRENALLKK